jgi:hypothetical protein
LSVDELDKICQFYWNTSFNKLLDSWGYDENIYFSCVQYTVVYSFQTQLKRVNVSGFGYISIKRQVIWIFNVRFLLLKWWLYPYTA